MEDDPISSVDFFQRITHDVTVKLARRDPPSAPNRELGLMRIDRDRIQEIRESLAQRRKRFADLKDQAEKELLAVIDSLPDTQVEQKKQAEEALRRRLSDMFELFLSEQLEHKNTLKFALDSYFEAYFDPKTSLLSRKAMVQTCSWTLVHEWRKQRDDPTYKPLDIYLEIGDGMLFHAGNEIRTSSGFDAALRNETNAQISLSRYFAGEYCPYPPFESKEEAGNDEYLKRFVLEIPPNKALFDTLVELCSRDGNYFEYYEVRVNAGGGDEFLRVYHVKGPDSEEILATARALTMAITKSQVISPEYDVLTGAERELSLQEIQRRNKFAEGLRRSTDALKVSSGKDSALLRQFLELYGKHLRERTLHPVFLDPRYDVCFDMATYERTSSHERTSHHSVRSLPTTEDAIMHFIAGTDAEHNRLFNGHGDPVYGLYDEQGKPDHAKIDAYTDSLVTRIQAILPPEDYHDSQKVYALVEKLLLEDILISFIDYLNDQVNAVAKPKKKLRVLLDAYLHEHRDPRSLFAVGATVATGRPKFVELTERQKVELTIQLIRNFEKECASQPDDPYLQRALSEWINIKQRYITTPRQDGTLPGYSSIEDINYDAILEDYTNTQRERRSSPRHVSI